VRLIPRFDNAEDFAAYLRLDRIDVDKSGYHQEQENGMIARIAGDYPCSGQVSVLLSLILTARGI
jgi:hypothetical protein